ncbi:SlyX family protein [Thiobacillus sp.]|uniref:SlyX family protein n=1 Tax=Thiobacillus sp. TaxID=924 RepID=UPI0025F65955|nr:SlyX family protein [Thiobacillus sp.]
MSDARLTELETKLAFAEDLLETLNQIVVRQQDQIDSLQQQLRLLNDRMKDSRPDETRTPRDEIPRTIRIIGASIAHDEIPFALSLSKGISEWARGRFGKLRTGFDKLSPNGGEKHVAFYGNTNS